MTEQINKAIEEEAERRVGKTSNAFEDYLAQNLKLYFTEGANFILSLFENKVYETWLEEILLSDKTNLGEQEVAPSLNNEKLYRWVKAKNKPKLEGEYLCKIRDSEFDAMEGYSKVKWERGKWTMYSEDEISFKVIEWLEEINPQPK